MPKQAFLTLALATTALPYGALAQDVQPPAPDLAQSAQDEDVDVEPESETDTIVVQGTRIRGQLIVDEPPIAEYGEEDIQALGVSSIEELLEAIAPDTQSSARGGRGGGRPVFLINGIRVSSWREFRSYPPEAVQKVEVFAEEVAQRFGFRPDQRVVNIILKPNFRQLTGEVEYAQPDRGGYSRNEQELTYLRIGEEGRLNFNVEVEDQSLLTEAERGLAIDGDEASAPFRSLIPDTFGLEATANYARSFIESGTSLSLNGTYERSETRSLSGLAIDGATALERRGSTDSFSTGATVNRGIGDWTATFTNDNTYSESTTEIDQRDGTNFDTAETQTLSTTNKATFIGYPIELPAGEITTTVDLNLDWINLKSQDTRADTDLDLTRRRLAGGLNVNIPLAERNGPLGVIGGISLNLAGGVEDLSDFGTLPNWTASLNWQPTEKLNLSATRIWREVAPGLTSLGNPRIEELNVPVFDYATGDTELATVISGGNPALPAETQSDWQFGANWELPFWERARFQVDYGINRSRNVTSTPGFSAAFESAFPDRVTRDENGVLLAVDQRPITLYRTRSRILSFGLSARGQIGAEPERPERQAGGRTEGRGEAPSPEQMQAMRAALCADPPRIDELPERIQARLQAEDGTVDPEKLAAARERMCSADSEQASGRQGGGARNPFARGDDDGDDRPRYFLSLNHAITLENEVELAENGPVFDQLDGELIAGGTVPRNTTRLEGGIFWQGYGLRVSGRYTGEAVIRGNDLQGSTDLFFSDLATFDLRLFANLDEIFERDEGWMKGLRVSLVADNVFDSRRRVVDANGVVPDAYEPFRIDPTGRYLGIDLRKAF
ncbi:hypothetical protein E3U23_05840 [Erythrobacter litoralis]|uniref:TonB-dependent receptor plug domain-containing protein n=1 Tax=Erythrobacter litoralis TaxID=39960 RepID=UPI002435C538|nr:hypothetical protein [Erythrobacter litoralis]MDG6078713.1 hypothetical protein [Erythrobacter litoralis]